MKRCSLKLHEGSGNRIHRVEAPMVMAPGNVRIFFADVFYVFDDEAEYAECAVTHGWAARSPLTTLPADRAADAPGTPPTDNKE